MLVWISLLNFHEHRDRVMRVRPIYIFVYKPIVHQEPLRRLTAISIENLLVFFDVNKRSHFEPVTLVVKEPISLVHRVMVEHVAERHYQISFLIMDMKLKVPTASYDMGILKFFKCPFSDLWDVRDQVIINLFYFYQFFIHAIHQRRACEKFFSFFIVFLGKIVQIWKIIEQMVMWGLLPEVLLLKQKERQDISGDELVICDRLGGFHFSPKSCVLN